MKGIPEADKGVPDLEVCMHVDSSSLLHVKATDLDSGIVVNAELKRKGALTADELKAKMKSAGVREPDAKKAKVIHLD